MLSKNVPTDTILVTIRKEQFVGFDSRLCKIPAAGGILQCVSPPFAGEISSEIDMVQMSRDRSTVAAVVREDKGTMLYIFAVPNWDEPLVTRNAQYEVYRSRDYEGFPRLWVSPDGSKVHLTNPNRGLTYVFRKANEWRPEEISGVRDEISRISAETSAELDGGLAVGPSSLSEDVIMVGVYSGLVQSRGLFQRLLDVFSGGTTAAHLYILERRGNDYDRYPVLAIPSGMSLQMKAVSENGDTAVAIVRPIGHAEPIRHFYVMRRDDPEQRWLPREPIRPEETRWLVVSPDGRVLIVSVKRDSETSGVPTAYVPYDAYAVVWDGQNWSEKHRLFGPFDMDRFRRKDLFETSPDNAMIGGWEHTPGTGHYLCVAKVTDGQRVGEFPIGSGGYTFSPDSQWITYRCVELDSTGTRFLWNRYVARVDGSGRRLLLSTPVEGHHLVGWGS